MKMQREIVDEVPVIGLVEDVEIDIGNLDNFKAAFAELVEEQDRSVVLDLSRVEFFDSAGLGGLLTLHKRLKQQDGQLVVAGARPSVAEVFRVVGFDLLFASHPDVKSAVASTNG